MSSDSSDFLDSVQFEFPKVVKIIAHIENIQCFKLFLNEKQIFPENVYL